MAGMSTFVDDLVRGYAAPPGDARPWAISDRVVQDPRSMIERRRDAPPAPRRMAAAPGYFAAPPEPVFRGPTPPMPQPDVAPAIQTFMASFPSSEPAAAPPQPAPQAAGPTAGLPSLSSVARGVMGGAAQSGEGFLDTLRSAGALTRGFLDGTMDTRTPGAVESAFDAATLAGTGAIPRAATAARTAVEPVEAVRLGLAKHFDDPRYGLPSGAPGPEAAAAIENVRSGLARSMGDPGYGLPPQGSRQAADDAIAALQAGVDRYLASAPESDLAGLSRAYMTRK